MTLPQSPDQSHSAPARHQFAGTAQDRPLAEAVAPLFASFAFDFAAALRQQLSAEVQISFDGGEIVRYDHFIASRRVLTCFSILRVDPPGAQICLDLSPEIAHPMIERLLGGKGDSPAPPPRRTLTQIEQGLVLQIIERAAATMADTWSSVGVETVREEGLSNDPAQVRIMPRDEMVFVAAFHISFKGHSGEMSLCLPAPVTGMLAGERCSMPRPAQTRAQRQFDTQNLKQNIMRSAIELRALLAQTKLRLSEVLALQEGDIITTDTPVDSLIPLQMRGCDVRHGKLGQLQGNRAIEITRPDQETRQKDDSRHDDEAAGGRRNS